MKAWERFPVVTAVLLGGGLYFLLAPFLRSPETIRVDAETAASILKEHESRLGRTLRPDEREEAIGTFVDAEILLREAYRLGFHESDAYVRQRLLARMRLAMAEQVAPPSRAELRAYYRTHAERYASSETVTIEHVFFAGTEDPGRPREQEDFRKRGEKFWLGPILRDVSRDNLKAVLGPDFAAAVFELSPGRWHGPIRSTRGGHYVRVVARNDVAIPPFTAVEAVLRSDWLSEKRQQAFERSMGRIRDRYQVASR